MATLAARGSGTPVTSGTTWAALTNAVDGTAGTNPATYTTYTNATASAVGYIEISGYNFSSSIAATDTLNSVTVNLRHFENNTGRFASVRFQPYDGATAIGSLFTATLATGARNDSTTFPVTLAQLRSATFKIRVTITGAASTQSRVESIDYVDVTADYTIAPPSITQAAYRFYADGTETGSTALAAQDTAPTVDTSGGDVNLQVRARLQSTTAVAVPATDDFQLQWEKNTSGTWNNASAETLVDSYADTNYDTAEPIGHQLASDKSKGQSFLGNGQPLTRCGFYLRKVGSTTGNISAQLFAHTGTFGTSSIATGSALATSTNSVTHASLSTSYTWVYFTFDGTLTLTNATPYVIAVTTDQVLSTSHYVDVGVEASSPTHAGNGSHGAAFPSIAATFDTIFELYTGGGSAAVAPYASANLTDGAATTNRLGAGSGSFVAGKVSETGLVTDLGWSANNYTEVLYSVTLKQADLAPTDTVKFRVLRNGATTAAAFVRTARVSIATTDSSAQTVTTAAFTPSNDSLLVAVGGYILDGGSTDESGNYTISSTPSLTWTAQANVGATASFATGMRIWTAPVTTGASTTVTFNKTTGNDAMRLFGSVTEYTGYNTSSPVGVTGTDTSVASNGADSVTLSGAPAATSEIIGGRCGGTAGTGTHLATPAAGHVEIHDLDSTDNAGMQTQARTAGSTSTAFSWDDTAAGTAVLDNSCVGLAIEIKAAGLTYPTVTIGAAGPTDRTGTATGTLTVAGSSSGTKQVTATATATLTLAGAAAGAPGAAGTAVVGTATGTLVVAGVAAGTKNITATAVGQLAIAGVSTGVHGVTATAVGALAVAGTATGTKQVRATATGALAVAGSSSGVRDTRGTATAAIALTGTATGVRTFNGVATGGLTVAGTASGIKTVAGTATGTVTVAGTAAGHRVFAGTANGSITVTGAATGLRTAAATATGTLTIAGTASGTKQVTASATGQVVLGSTALGLVEGNAVGTATGALTVAGTATGARGTKATATGALSLSGTAVARRGTAAVATGTLTLAGTATATKQVVATAVGTIGLAGTATGAAPVAFEIIGEWNDQQVDALQWGSDAVVEWFMLTAVQVNATATGGLTLGGAATGYSTKQGHATGTLTFTAIATGVGETPATGVDVLLESFNNLTSAPWAGTGTIVTGRTGTAVSVTATTGPNYTIPAPDRSDYMTIGFAFKVSHVAITIPFLTFRRAGAAENTLAMSGLGELFFLRGDVSQIGARTATGVITVGPWYYVELQYRSAPLLVDSWFKLRVNGVLLLNSAGENFPTQVAGVPDMIRLEASGGVTHQFDDLYLSTGAGAPFKGSISIP